MNLCLPGWSSKCLCSNLLIKLCCEKCLSNFNYTNCQFLCPKHRGWGAGGAGGSVGCGVVCLGLKEK